MMGIIMDMTILIDDNKKVFPIDPLFSFYMYILDTHKCE